MQRQQVLSAQIKRDQQRKALLDLILEKDLQTSTAKDLKIKLLDAKKCLDSNLKRVEDFITKKEQSPSHDEIASEMKRLQELLHKSVQARTDNHAQEDTHI